MPARTATVVVTTIFEAEALDGYFENFKRFGHLDQVEVVIIRTVRPLLQPSSARDV
jgi:hypothetical protein